MVDAYSELKIQSRMNQINLFFHTEGYEYMELNAYGLNSFGIYPPIHSVTWILSDVWILRV